MTTRPICRSRHITVSNKSVRRLITDGATPERIGQRLDQARTDIADLQAEVAWLEQLLQQRTADIEAGTWSPPPNNPFH